MSRIICISNRVSLPDPQTGKIKAGGLAVGVKAALESNGGGLWFGWDGSICKARGRRRTVKRTQHEDITFLTIPLREREYNEYYKGMANENLWPLMHGLGRHIEARAGMYQTYRQVNRLFARMILPHIRPGDIVWVHDYHLIPLGRELRLRGVRNRIGYFNHIPMPSREFIEGAHVPFFLKQHYEELMKNFFYYDLVGFQSFRDFRNFDSCFPGKTSCHMPYQGVMKRYNGRQTAFGVFPISIETDEIARNARRHAVENPRRKERKTLIGAERLDYTKGLSHRLEGFYRFLKNHPDWHEKVRYSQITPLSRADISQYKTAITRTREVADKIAQEFGGGENGPLFYSEEGLPRDRLIGAFCHSDVGLVTPLIDGQNLVAKEYIAAQNPRDPGMLILSRHAGAAEELEKLGVLCVDPVDPDDIAEKIYLALNAPREIRMDCYRRTYSHLYQYDIAHWAESFLKEICAVSGAQQQHTRPQYVGGAIRGYYS